MDGLISPFTSAGIFIGKRGNNKEYLAKWVFCGLLNYKTAWWLRKILLCINLTKGYSFPRLSTEKHNIYLNFHQLERLEKETSEIQTIAVYHFSAF